MFKTIDLSSWARKDLFNLYKNYEDPFFNLTANVEVTHLFNHCKAQKESFFLSCLYASTCTINEIENLRMRIKNEQVILYDVVNCGSAVFHESEKTFTFCHFDYYENRAEFLRKGKESLDAHNKNPILDPLLNELNSIHHSVLPWVHFTQFKHARRAGNKESIPRVTFGKVKETLSGRFEIPVSIEVNHALADGYHVGVFFERLKEVFREVVELP